MKAHATLAMAATVAALLCCQSCTPIKDLYQQGVAKSRRPGQQLVETPEATLKKRCCPPYRKDVLYLEEAGAIPERLEAGSEVNHRIRYAFCPSTPSGMLQARVLRTVYHRGRKVFTDASDEIFCAGTWTVDAFIRVPRNAAGGWYTIKVEIRTQRGLIKRSSTFFVKEKKDPVLTRLGDDARE